MSSTDVGAALDSTCRQAMGVGELVPRMPATAIFATCADLAASGCENYIVFDPYADAAVLPRFSEV